MDELMRKMEEARRHIQPGWDDDHAALVLVGMRRRARRRSIARATIAIAAIAIATIAGALMRPARQEPQIAAAPIAAKDERVVKLGDGSIVTPLTIDSRIVLKKIAPERVDVDFE